MFEPQNQKKSPSSGYIAISVIVVLAVLGFSIYQSNKLTDKVHEFQVKVTELTTSYSKLNSLYESEKKLNEELTNLNNVQKDENNALVKEIIQRKRQLTVVKSKIAQKNVKLRNLGEKLAQKDKELAEVQTNMSMQLDGLKSELTSVRQENQIVEKKIDSLNNQIDLQQVLKTQTVNIYTFENKVTDKKTFVNESASIKELRVVVKLSTAITAANKLRVELINNGVKYTRFSYLEKMVSDNTWNFDFKVKQPKMLTQGILSAKVFCDRIYIGDAHVQLN